MLAILHRETASHFLFLIASDPVLAGDCGNLIIFKTLSDCLVRFTPLHETTEQFLRDGEAKRRKSQISRRMEP